MVKTIGNVQKDAQVRAVASGALSNGDTIIVNSDGTVSAVAGVTGGVGTAVVYEAASADTSSIVFDSNSNKIVITYRDNGSSGYGTCVVGTVSGTSISFGTPVVFESDGTSWLSSAFDSTNNKVVVVFRDNGDSGYGKAAVGTVSGTSISFGTTATFNAGDTRETATAYDVNAQKIVISYKDQGNSNYGTAIVGTVSGTSISFGSEAVFRTDNVEEVRSVYDVGAQKVVTVYKDVNPSFQRYGTAVVCTVSGTSISFGTPVIFASVISEHIGAAYDSDAQKIIIGYRDNTNSNYGRAVVGTVSGTSISFGATATFSSTNITETAIAYNASAQKSIFAFTDVSNSSKGTLAEGTVSGTDITFEAAGLYNSASSGHTSAGYDSSSNKVIISYENGGNSNYGTAIVYASGSTNLTSDNFIGFADGAYADTQSAAINSTCSVDLNQTGLTAGQKYYVQSDGTLSTTAGDPTVEAGTAISPTKILVKG